jgi:hypothetical protein
MANEIFSCEINAILDRFFDAPEKLKKTKSEPTPTATDKLETKKEEQELSSSDDEEETTVTEAKKEEEKAAFPETPAEEPEPTEEVSY